MAPKSGARLPSPPADLSWRRLPIKRVRGPIYRIHRAAMDCLHFSKDGSGRFDDPRRQYGVLYGALQAEGAFAEVFLRRLSLMLLRETDLAERILSIISCGTLACVDLTGAGLRRLSCDNRISTEKPYNTVGLWSRALFTHPKKMDGIIYRSRHNPQFRCVALFDRCRGPLTLDSSEPLLAAHRRAWTADLLSKHGLAIEPAA